MNSYDECTPLALAVPSSGSSSSSFDALAHYVLERLRSRALCRLEPNEICAKSIIHPPMQREPAVRYCLTSESALEAQLHYALSKCWGVGNLPRLAV